MNMEKAKGGGDKKSSEYHQSSQTTGDPSGEKTLSEMGLSKDRSSKSQKLARVDVEDFENHSNDESMILFTDLMQLRCQMYPRRYSIQLRSAQ